MPSTSVRIAMTIGHIRRGRKLTEAQVCPRPRSAGVVCSRASSGTAGSGASLLVAGDPMALQHPLRVASRLPRSVSTAARTWGAFPPSMMETVPRRAVYEEQRRLYVRAVEIATGEGARGVLLVV